jgi:hypothetical protein
VKAAILRGKPGIQIKVDKKTNKGGLTVTAGDGVLVWSLKLQGTVSKVDLSPLEQAIRTLAGGRGGGDTAVEEECGGPKKPKGRKKTKKQLAAELEEAAANGFAATASSLKK